MVCGTEAVERDFQILLMELAEPKPKKHCKLHRSLPLPIILKKDGTVKKFTAYFNGFSVILDNPEDMKTIISMGYFGKANLSRNYPQFSQPGHAKIIRRRQLNNRKTCSQNFPTKIKPDKVIVVPDSDSDNDEYFTNLKPKYETDSSGLKEIMWLGLEEAFFLSNTVKCLGVSYKGQELNSKQLWELFKSVEPDFIRNYITYFYYRGKNWVVKPGIKFGGDFMLYKEGPPFYHATYVVVIEVLDETGERNEKLTSRLMDNVSVMGLNRLCETAGKELLICRVKWPKTVQISYENFTDIEIQEIVVRRWIPSQERENNLMTTHL